ncbi:MULTISPECIES: hypothetical protein [Pseudomonas]|uniref:hypothetical protein n=1 Tax=Pseudomonas TaxID=286 RepID=UPI0002E6578B|nr:MULTISPECIES: hypothetical protein [Pseudomonas]WOB56568.1 hypothetical protein NY023_15135 [Pseudomonas sp. NBB]
MSTHQFTGTLDQLREEVDLHNVDLTRCRITPLSDGGFAVAFDAPVVPIDKFLPDAPDSIVVKSVLQAEATMLSGALKLQIAERQAVRNGSVGRDSMWVRRTPISAEELDAYRARQREAALQRKIAAELVQAVEERQAEANKVAAAELAARYPGSVAEPRKASKPKPVPSLPSVAVKPSARGAK